MPVKPLTSKQSAWLKHVKAADTHAGSMSDYALEQGLAVKALYQWKTKLIRLGHYQPLQTRCGFLSVRTAPAEAPIPVCSVKLVNGTVIEFTGVLDRSFIDTIVRCAGLR